MEIQLQEADVRRLLEVLVRKISALEACYDNPDSDLYDDGGTFLEIEELRELRDRVRLAVFKG